MNVTSNFTPLFLENVENWALKITPYLKKYPFFVNPWRLPFKNIPPFLQIHEPCPYQKMSPFSVELQTTMASILIIQCRARDTVSCYMCWARVTWPLWPLAAQMLSCTSSPSNSLNSTGMKMSLKLWTVSPLHKPPSRGPLPSKLCGKPI